MYKKFIDELSVAAQKNEILEKLLYKFNINSLTPIVGVELEFYLLKEFDIDSISVRTSLQIKIEKGELQYEIDTKPTSDIIKLVKDIKKYKSVLTEAFDNQITFDPKPYKEDYGNSMHFHVNLLNSDKTNYFDDNNKLYKAAAFICANMMKTLLVFINTEQELLRVNHKYMSPTHICFGGNNRTVAVRVPSQIPRRLEHRLSNPLSCPYLSIFVILKSIYESIIADENSSSNILNKFQKIHGNAFDPQYRLEAIPNSLEEISRSFDIKFFDCN